MSQQMKRNRTWTAGARVALGGLIVAGLAASLLACGFGFPNRFLLLGDEVVLEAPADSFATLVGEIAPTRAGELVDLGGGPFRHVAQSGDAGADRAAAEAQAGARTARDFREFDLYAGGRDRFLADDADGAVREWRAVLALPEANRRWRTTYAWYMIGRARHAVAPDEAIAAYREVRRAAAAGFADTPGLAAASIGWEAQIALNRRDFTQAMALYMEHFVAGAPSALPSLSMCCEALLSANDAELAAVAADANARAVMTAWMASSGFARSLASGPIDRRRVTWSRWTAALTRAGARDVKGAPYLAWGAYQYGRFDEAAQWSEIAGDRSPIGHWIAAKLLAREGRMDESIARLSAAIRLLPPREREVYSLKMPDSDALTPNESDGSYMRGELGVLLAGSQRYTEALETMLAGGHWADAAHLAERVLTIDELRGFADAAEQGRPALDAEALSDLRWLLARRLARAGRFEEARPCFPVAQLAAFDGYVAGIAALRDGAMARDQRVRAMVLGARAARHAGMEILGTELDPDFHIYGGSFQTRPLAEARARVGDGALAKPTADELARIESSRVPDATRFHYRRIAADLAWEAASIMPDGSADTAAVLCEAGSWLKTAQPEVADRFYKALVRRCGQTPLGKAADSARWFPAMTERDLAFADLRVANGSDTDANAE